MADPSMAALAQVLQQSRQQSALNPFTVAGQVVGQAPATTSTGQAFNGLAQGILSIVGARQAQQEQAGNLSRLNSLMAAGDLQGMMADPLFAPVGQAFAIQNANRLAESQQKLQDAQAVGDVNLRNDLIKMKVEREMNDPRRQFLASQIGANPAPAVAPALAQTAAGEPVQRGPIATTPGAPMASQLQQRVTELVMQGFSPDKALDTANKEIEPIRARDAEEIKALADQRQKARSLQNIGDTVLSVYDKAGVTGPATGAYRLGASLLAPFSEDQSQKLTAESVLDQFRPEIIAAVRPPGSGTVSNYESAMYIGAGPGSHQTPEANKLMALTYKTRGQIEQDRVEFKEWYFQNRGTLQGADQAWDQLMGGFKLVDQNPQSGQIEVNTNFPDWRQVIQGQAPQQAPAAAAPSGGSPPGFQTPAGGSTPSSSGLNSNSILSAIKQVESSGNPNAVSLVGAQGAFQFMPATAQEYAAKLGISDYNPANVEQQEAMAAAKLADDLERFDGSLPLALAAYNAGPGRVADAVKRAGSASWDVVSKFLPQETQNYVPKVLSLLSPAEAVAQAPTPAEAPAPAQPAATEQTLAQKAGHLLGAVGQGATFGFADEIAAGARSVLPGFQDYASELAAIRGGQRQFDTNNPALSLGANIGGAATLPIGALFRGAKTLGGAAIRYAGGGALIGGGYGAGSGGEGTGISRKDAALEGAAIGAIASPVIAAGVKTAAKGGQIVAEKLATSPTLRAIAERLPSSGRAVSATGEAGRLKIGGASSAPPVTGDDLAVLKLARDADSQKLTKALERLGSDKNLTLAEATELPSLFLQTKEAATNPNTMNVVRPIIGARTAETTSRINKALENLGARGSFESGVKGAKNVVDLAKADIQKVVKPIYDKALKEVPVLDSKKINALIESPTIKSYINAAQQSFDTQKLGANATQVVKRALSDMGDDLSAMKKSISASPKEVRELTRDFTALKEEVYRLNPLLKEADSKFKVALEKSGLKEKGLKALSLIQQGDETQAAKLIFSGELTPVQITAIRKQFDRAGQSTEWREFVRAHISRIIEDAPNVSETSYAGAGKILNKLIGSQSNQARLKAAVGEDLFPKLFSALKREETYLQGTRQYAMGSPTKPLMDAAREREAAGGIGRMVSNWKEWTIDRIAKILTPEPDQEQFKRIAEILVNPEKAQGFLQRAIPVQRSLESIRAGAEAATRIGQSSGIKGQGAISSRKRKPSGR